MKTHDHPTKPIAGAGFRHWCGTAVRSSLAALVAAVAAVVPLQAQVFSGTYDLAGNGNNVTSFDFNGTPITGLTVSPLTKVGITSSSSTGNFRGNNWPTGATSGSDVFTGTVDAGKYIEFTLTASSGTIDLPTISFGVGRSSTGPRQWEWRSSVDGFTAAIPVTTVNAGLTHAAGVLTNPDSNSSWTGNEILTVGTSYQGLSSITFRLYGYNAEATTGTGGLQGNLTFGGTLTGGGPDTDPPVLVLPTSPADDATDVALNTTLAITFNETVVAATGDLELYETGNPTPVATLATSSATITGSTATFTLPTPLEYSTAYHVLLDAGSFQDAAGNALVSGITDPAVWNFGTVDPAPVVVSLLPAHEATDVVAEGVLFAIEYDRNVVVGSGLIQVVDAFEPSTVVATFDVANAAQVSVSGNLLSTVVPFDLTGGFTYAVLVPAGAVVSDDAAAAPSAAISGIEWFFTTILPDETPPAVSALTPSNGEGGAPISSTLQVTFDEDVTLGTGPWSIEVVDVTNGTTGFTYTEADTTNVSASGSLLTITPPAPFTELTDYRVTLSAGVVKDLADNASGAIGGVGAWEFTTAGPFVAGNVVISQVYGGGGNSGATLTNDFVELHNLSAETAFITGWSVQYASSAGSSWSVTPLTGSIPPGGYYLVQQAAGSGGTTALPTPDAIGSIAMAGTSGKVALVGNSTALTGADPLSDPLLQISDFVGYGTANAYEGTGATPGLSNTTAALRNVNGSVDTDDNGDDFVTGAPDPRNSASPPFLPTVDGGGIATAINAGGAAGTLSNLPLFASAVSGQTLAVTVTGTSADTLTTVEVQLPSDFSAPLIGNVTLTGPGSGGASAAVSGQTITVSNAAVTLANSLTVTVSGLTAPDASAVPADTGDRTIGVLTAGTGGTPTSIVLPPVVTTVVPVATVAALRAQPTDGVKTYLLNTEVVVTYATPTFRNQHWVQDATAGIVIDDQPAVLTAYAEGSGVTGLVGKLVVFNGLFELQPAYNAGELTSSGNSPAPLVVSLPDLIADPIAYQARLVQVNDVVFTSLPGTFGEGIEHPIALAADEMIAFNLRSFFDTDYQGTALPATELDLVGLIQTRNVTEDSFISPRKLADIITGLPPVDPGSPLATWDFTGAAGNQTSQPVSTTATGITAGDVTRGSGLTASSAGNSISSSGWSTGALDADDYYEFSVTIDASTTATLNSIAFAERRSGTGIGDFALRSSLDGYTADIAAINVPDVDTTRQQNITLPVSFAGLTNTTVTFRIYGYNAEAAGGTWRIANSTEFGGLVVLGTTTSTGGGYDDWADLYAGGGLPLADFDNDGVSNLMEYFYGVTSVGFTTTPQIIGNTITWPRDSDLTDVSFKVRISTDLVNWSDADNADVDLTNPDFITYTLPGAPAPFFVRLEVTQIP